MRYLQYALFLASIIGVTAIGVSAQSPDDVPDIAPSPSALGISCVQTQHCSEANPACLQLSSLIPDQQPASDTTEDDSDLTSVPVKQVLINEPAAVVPSGQEVVIAECMINGTEPICTTGDRELDQRYFGIDNLPSDQYRLQLIDLGSEQPVQQPFVPSTVSSMLVAQSPRANSDGRPVDSYMVAVYDRSITGPEYQQQSAGCVVISGATGRVIDRESLEPVHRAQVQVQQVSGQTASARSDQSGSYVLPIPEAPYRMVVDAPGFQFPVPSDRVTPGAHFLFQSFYHGSVIEPGQVSSVPEGAFYTIPVRHKSLIRNPVQPVAIESLIQSIDTAEQTVLLSGRVTHPGAEIILQAMVAHDNQEGQRVPTRTLSRTEADQRGLFQIRVPVSELTPRESIGQLRLQKPAQYPIASNGDPSPTTLNLDPILETVSGVARTPDGSVLPGATVELMIPSIERPVALTTANEQGEFQFNEAETPQMAYRVRSVPVTGSRQYLTDTGSVFAYAQSSIFKSPSGQVAGIQDTFDELAPPDSTTRIAVYVSLALFAGIAFLVISSVFLSHGAQKKVRTQKRTA